MIWCPTVSTGAFVARRNGKVFITGNSGFPKSLDVSKAIDGKLTTGRSDSAALREVNHTRPGDAVVRPSSTNGHRGIVGSADAGPSVKRDEPATDAARQWSGWGTALKPALEPITVARKPLATSATNVLRTVESELRGRGVRGEILWRPESASGAAKKSSRTNSSSTEVQRAAATSAGNAAASATPSGDQLSQKSSEQPGTGGLKQTQGASESFQGCTTSGCANPSSMPTEGSAHAAESVSETSSPSTTSTAAEPSTASKFTGRCTPNCDETVSRLDTESFAGIATGLTGSMETVRISRDSEGFFLWPKGLPEFVPGSPLTVAENVLAHGTGAINVDGCRVGWPDGKAPEIGTPAWGGPAKKLTAVPGQEGETVERAEPHQAGRWPANLILSIPEDEYSLRDDVTPDQLRQLAEWMDANP